MSRILSAAKLFLFASALIAAIILVVVLSTGGFHVSLLGASFLFDNVALTLICFLGLTLAGLVAKHGFRFKETFDSNEVWIVFSFSLICYMANGQTLAVGDTLPNRYLPFSLIREGNFDFDEFRFLYKADEIPYWLRQVKGHYVSYYPIGAGLLSVPFFVPSALGSIDPKTEFSGQLEKLAAASLTALSVVFVLLTLRRMAGRKMALLLTAVYAIGTTSLSVSSQALWQHGPSQLCLSVALYFIVRGISDARWIPPAGAALAFSIVCRPTDALIALPLSLYVAIHHFKKLHWFVLCALPAALFQLWYNLTYFGSIAIGQSDLAGPENWNGPLLADIAGLLFSPARGLFIYSPILLLLIPATILIWKKKEFLLLRYLWAGAFAILIVYGKWIHWMGGSCFGPRFFSDLNPLFVLMLVPIEPLFNSSKRARALFAVLFGFSVAAHSVGAFLDDRYWNTYRTGEATLVWAWTDNQVINPLRRIWIRNRIRFEKFPTSSDSPQMVSAAYDTSLPQKIEIRHSGVVSFEIGVTNTGKAAILAWQAFKDGGVRVGFRWQKGGKDLRRTLKFVRLRNDMLPGNRQEYWAAIEAPEKPGEYVLQLELFDNDQGWFSDLGIAPVRVDATVD